jgi:hypothetical protein
MAEKIRGGMPKSDWKRTLPDDALHRLQRRKLVLETLRKQTAIAEQRLRNDIFNTWRTGEGTMRAIGEACGYTTNWISLLIQRIKNDDTLLEQAIDDWMKENPGEELK